MRAPVLLLDEPLASLDPLARREFLHVLIDAVRADGSTALLSSHVITDIEQACDRLLVLGGGAVLLDLSIAGAIAEHSVVEEVGPGGTVRAITGTVVGVFPGRPVSDSASSVATAPARPAGDARGGRARPPRRRPKAPTGDRHRGAGGMSLTWARLTLG